MHQHKMERSRVSKAYWGIIFIVFGGLFLLRNLGYIDFTFTMRRHWPVILIVVGLSIIVKSLVNKQQ